MVALALDRQSKYEETKLASQQTLTQKEKTFRLEHSVTMTSMNKLLLVPNDCGKYKAAELMELYSLARIETALGPKHPDILTIMSNMAVILDANVALPGPIFSH
jgi:hypothetical protein